MIVHLLAFHKIHMIVNISNLPFGLIILMSKTQGKKKSYTYKKKKKPIGIKSKKTTPQQEFAIT
jgi:hypothetical protein